MSPHAGSALRVAALVLVGVVLQTVLGPDLRVAGVAPDLMTLVTVCAALGAGPRMGAVVGFCAGLATDIFLTDTPLGLTALTLCLVGAGVGEVRANILEENRLVTPLLVAVASGVAVLLFVGIGDVAGQAQLTRTGHAWILRVAVVEAAWNLVLGLPVNWLMGRATAGSAGAESLGRGRPDRVPLR